MIHTTDGTTLIASHRDRITLLQLRDEHPFLRSGDSIIEFLVRVFLPPVRSIHRLFDNFFSHYPAKL
jgi:hypothetical protein